MFRKQNSTAISHPVLLTACQMVTSGLSWTARPVGWSLTATHAQDHVTSKRGGPSPYRAVEPWLLLLLLLLYNPSGRTMALGSTKPLTEMSTRNISWGWRRPVRRADNLTTFMCRLSRNLGASTSWKPEGLSRPVMGLLYLYLYYY
jgi:hypothetical protein